MKPTDVPIKTDAGNRELGQRVHKLTARARSLLIVIHGTETVADLSRTFQGFGNVDGSLNELAELGLDRREKHRALVRLQQARLVELVKAKGRTTQVILIRRWGPGDP